MKHKTCSSCLSFYFDLISNRVWNIFRERSEITQSCHHLAVIYSNTYRLTNHFCLATSSNCQLLGIMDRIQDFSASAARNVTAMSFGMLLLTSVSDLLSWKQIILLKFTSSQSRVETKSPTLPSPTQTPEFLTHANTSQGNSSHFGNCCLSIHSPPIGFVPRPSSLGNLSTPICLLFRNR